MSLIPAGPCPACAAITSRAIQTIDLKDQHQSYVPGNLEIQGKLSEAAEIPSDQYTVFCCSACGLAYCDPLQAPSAEWYRLFYNSRPLYPKNRWEFDFVLNQLNQSDCLGEIGCGNGEFLKRCRRLSIEAFGADFSRDAVQSCLEQGLNASIMDVSKWADISMGDCRCTQVVAFQVLEHLDNLASLFGLASSWSIAGGRFWVAVPSNRRPSRIFGERDVLDEPPHHMTRWTECALRFVGSRWGWDLRQIYYEPLSVAARVWWCTTRTALYRRALKAGLAGRPYLERALRSILLPVGAVKALLLWKQLSGQTMLAEYSRQ
jgi:SAM-dependent methyltransferase